MSLEFFIIVSAVGILATYVHLIFALWAPRYGLPRIDLPRGMTQLTFGDSFERPRALRVGDRRHSYERHHICAALRHGGRTVSSWRARGARPNIRRHSVHRRAAHLRTHLSPGRYFRRQRPSARLDHRLDHTFAIRPRARLAVADPLIRYRIDLRPSSRRRN